MLKKLAPLFLVLCLMLPLAPAAFAQHEYSGKWWNRPLVAQKLALTDEEKAKLDEIYIQSERIRIDLKSEVARQRFELTQVMENADAGEQDILARYKTLEKAQDDLAAERFRFLMEVRTLIGVERFRDLSAMFEEARKNRTSRWKDGMPGRQMQPPGQMPGMGRGMGPGQSTGSTNY